MALASLSVDLDPLPHYCRIHGLPETLLDARQRTLVHEVAVERFLTLFSELGLKATLFAIGEDLEDPAARAALAHAHGLGMEVGNHSLSHDYALSRHPAEWIEREVRVGADRIQACTGERPVGFRAPGYTLSPALLGVLEAQGYRYDSSVFPAAPYWAAKALVMGGMRLRGRSSGAILDSPRVLAAPRMPYHPDRRAPYRRGELGLLELPISVERLSRTPFIGTLVTLAPKAVVAAVYRSLRKARFLNFELHAVDLLGHEDGLPPALVARQRDLGLPVVEKLSRVREAFLRIAGDFEVVTLAQAALRLSRKDGPGARAV